MLAALPQRIQEAANDAYRQFCADPAHPALAHHQLDDTKRGRHHVGSSAVSVTARYRAIYFQDGVNVWYWIGSHEDYNNFTGKK